MTDPPSHDQAARTFGGADPTRDIRLPPMADRPPSAMPREWASVQPAASASAPARPYATPASDLRTDELDPPRRQPRERTITFASPEMAGGRPAPTVGRTLRRPRRWPWVVLTLLPVVVIVVTGAWWLLLLRAA
jgi:hypothetical protein